MRKEKKILWKILIFVFILISSFAIYSQARYVINKKIDMNITSSKFIFNANFKDTTIKREKENAELTFSINNFNSDTDYNTSDINYTISLEDSSKYTLIVTDKNNGVIKGGTSNTNNITLKFTAVSSAKIKNSEEITLLIKTSSPYEKTIKQKININMELISGMVSGIEKITSEDCEEYLDYTNIGGYNALYSGNNGELEYASDKSIILDADNPILYKKITGLENFNSEYSLYFTINADFMQPNNTEVYPTSIISIGSGDGSNKSHNLVWAGLYKGYLQIISYFYGKTYSNDNYETLIKGYLSYDVSKYSNSTVNMQITANRTGMTKVYINGVKIVEIESGGQEIVPDYITIGDLRPLRNLKFNGKLYDYAIYQKELTEDEIIHNWQYAQNEWMN